MDREKIRQNYRICRGLIATAAIFAFAVSPVMAAVVWEWETGDPCAWYDWDLETGLCGLTDDGPLELTSDIVAEPDSPLVTFYPDYWEHPTKEFHVSITTNCENPVTALVSYALGEYTDSVEVPGVLHFQTYDDGLAFLSDGEDCLIYSVTMNDLPEKSAYEQSLPPNDAVHINDAGIMSGELPMPLPRLPGSVNMPDIAFPYVDFSEWPSVTDGRESVGSTINGELYLARDIINEQYDRARDGINAVRETTQSIRDFVGNPMTSVTAQSDSRIVSVNSMASEMAQSVSYSLGYLRAVSNLGPMGLDLVFIFIGLGWVLFMNVVEWIMAVIVWLLKMLAGAITFAFRILELVMELIRTIRALILI